VALIQTLVLKYLAKTLPKSQKLAEKAHIACDNAHKNLTQQPAEKMIELNWVVIPSSLIRILIGLNLPGTKPL